MAINLLYNFSNDSRRKVSIGLIELDATVREVHERASAVAEHPIESGGIISDHIYPEPDRLLIEGEISDTPVRLFGGLTGLSSRRSIDAYEQLVDLKNSRELVAVVTGLQVYNNMAITSLVCPRDRATGRRLRFTAEFRQVEKVATQVVEIPAEKVSQEQSKRAPSEVDAGRQAAKTVDTQSSLLLDLGNKIGDIIGLAN